MLPLAEGVEYDECGVGIRRKDVEGRVATSSEVIQLMLRMVRMENMSPRVANTSANEDVAVAVAAVAADVGGECRYVAAGQEQRRLFESD